MPDVSKRRIREAVRAFLMVATMPELLAERALSIERGDTFRADCIDELIREAE